MAVITFENVTKSYGDTTALRGITFTVAQGEFVVIVGPSGCGKSTLLRLVTGLDDPDTGRILLDDADVRGRAPKDRGCAMVFQSYALYPHWTVFDNIAFPLRVRRAPKSVITDRVESIATSLELTDHLRKRPKALSGGERQRVALGRAMAADPRIFLFDEPLSNLDAPLRAGMRTEIVARHRALGKTALYVTHDQTEALTMGDRILVMNEGAIVGEGTPQELYDNPPNRFVATFLGRPAINLIPGRIDESEGILRFAPFGWTVPPLLARRVQETIGRDVELGVRPEYVSVSDGTGESPWRILTTEFLGDKLQCALSQPHGALTGFKSPDANTHGVTPDASVAVEVNLDFAVVFDPATGDRLA